MYLLSSRESANLSGADDVGAENNVSPTKAVRLGEDSLFLSRPLTINSMSALCGPFHALTSVMISKDRERASKGESKKVNRRSRDMDCERVLRKCTRELCAGTYLSVFKKWTGR